ncbi:conserved hypothetical protein [Catenulispora acidiphila DSM 44928]|uniref:DUF4184 family protein n=1 Tax=Catenulispora acidiphila (strain DSM 44928 / JCM 14897 / NBRC 102108 / NRRL B-24433 / ID139908) TaxID=479433 RepID=C7QBS6_CATAD|nr:DUF4184 family protein [Catenulispora acidiphila]ACU72545.1 conserved hypothetical protein [Catenulispora acidiphila DSM 44928]
MPFTLAHPAAVLPLTRRGRARGGLVGSALVFGSIAPDVPYFAGAFGVGDLAHTWAAVPTLDLGIAFVLAGVWHRVLRAPLVGLLPVRWAAAADQLTAPRERRVRFSSVSWFVLSAVIGTVTHVVWDGFTHPGRFGVRLFPVLQNARVLGEPPYVLLQYGCSVLGVGALGFWTVREMRRAVRSGTSAAPPAGNRQLAFGLIAVSAILGTAYRAAEWAHPGMPWTSLVPVLAFGAVAGAAIAVLLYSLLILRRL